MKRLVGSVICTIVMSVGLMASPASAEPHGYWMWCRTGSGLVITVTDPLQCTRGNVKFISFYDGHVGGSIDVEALQLGIDRSKTLADAYNDCKAHIICGVIAGGFEGFLLSKVKAAYTALKGLIRR
jgi:hypothetical protein